MSDVESEEESYDKSEVDSEEKDDNQTQMINLGSGEGTKILVTGGNGYLGSHIVFYLLEKGVRVKVSVSDLSDTSRYNHLKTFAGASDRLEIVEGKLTDKNVWKSICEGCDAIIHTASPNPFKAPKQELELIYPAVEGTLAILHAAVELKIKRVVMTSAISAVKGGKYKLTYNEEAWGEPENVTGIEKSKIFSERVAWYFHKENREKLAFTVICPGFLLGPTLQDHCEFSSGLFFKKFMDGRVSSLLKMHIPICDVRDVALAHVNALWNSLTINQRYICAEGSHWFENFSSVLAREFTPTGFQFPSKTISAFPLKLIAFFDSGVKTMLPFYGKEIYFSNEKLKKDFKFNFRNFDETLIDMGYNFIEKKFIEKVTQNTVQDEDNDGAALKRSATKTEELETN